MKTHFLNEISNTHTHIIIINIYLQNIIQIHTIVYNRPHRVNMCGNIFTYICNEFLVIKINTFKSKNKTL